MAQKIESDHHAYDRNEYDTAVAAFGSARDVCQQWGDKHGEASALMDLGVTHQRFGNWADAKLAYEDALELFEDIEDETGKATAMNNLAALYKRLGAGEQSIPQLEKAVEMFDILAKDEYQADTLRILSQVQLQQGEWLDAIISYHRALSRMANLTTSQGILQTSSSIVLRVLGVQL